MLFRSVSKFQMDSFFVPRSKLERLLLLAKLSSFVNPLLDLNGSFDDSFLGCEAVLFVLRELGEMS